MIAKVTHHLFNRRMTTVSTPNFECWVSTAKEGLLRPLSTMLLEVTYDFTGPKRRPCAKIIYSRSLRTVDRLEMHELIVKMLDEQGMAGADFSDIVIGICNDLKGRGVAKEAIHLV
jgi:hypothetical protein